MRLHDLEVTAFGPFPGTERVDFDALNDAGLFLLSGATGAGKTSILDAVCFALYGQVPGVRGVKALKSQHAADEARPEVVLDFSVRDRRFVVRRSPEWTRPKRRGEGTATEKARASIAEVRADGEDLLSHRAAEVGQLVSDLVGMQAAQFQQVAMLPQGEFQRFLQASSQDRHDVLQRLFHTDRFSRIEDWVADHSRQRRDAAADGQSTVQRLVDTLAERAAVEPPEHLSPDRLLAAAGSGEVSVWAHERLDDAAGLDVAARAGHDQAAAAAAAAASRLDRARERAAARARRDEAQAQLSRLEAEVDAVTAATAALDGHCRAVRVLPALAVLERAQRESTQATATATRSAEAARARDLAPEPAWADTVAELREQVTRTQRLTPLLDEHTAATDAVGATRRRLAEAEAARVRAATAHEALPGERDRLRRALDAAREEAGRGEALRLQLASTRQRARAAADLPAAEATAATLADRARDARDLAADTRDHMQDLVQRRLDGIAAELAGRLEDGRACLVCGATEHPDPASSDQASVTADEQEAAGAAFDVAQAAHADLVARAADADRQVASLRELAAGRDAATWDAEVERLRGELATAEESAARAEALAKDLVCVEQRLAEAERALRAHDVRAAELAETLRADEGRAVRAETHLAEAWPDPGLDASDLPRLVERLRTDLAAAGAAHDTAEAAAGAASRVDEVRASAVEASTAEGFADLDDVRSAVLTDARHRDHEELLADHARREAAARSVLDEPAVAALVVASEDAPLEGLDELETLDGLDDLDDLAASARSAQETAEAATRVFHLAEQRLTSVRSLVDRLDAALTDWAPARDEFLLAESMSRLVRGLGGDNQLQMRLSSYVLATRLDQVLDAANERLSHLRDQRYLLQRTGRAARRGSQAGLGLEVVDQWTGDVRDPATLSGGETFVVSLSLALGLADVVTHEAGGTEIETLFVDEGFGTLDADTLDDVMDRLDGLRAGGRTVGVVSHVTELRSRIPVQLHVDKTPAGSSIRAHALVG
ncbi:AAA family ATPase [Nocardioides iriomotensis]|uniref:Nuclease SbcCD subunit C n=1 Tax=Nocardioides iriomotensis TaxID=715784 RepID=A0A4Q5J2C5_9ACTN|nr:SMC family ATPase [Nocardioides iriomotensis]RYU11601.1 SMC family ATPase [Nocardioides iriomotensis]